MSSSMLTSLKRGTINCIRQTTKVAITDEIIKIIDDIYKKLSLSDMIIRYNDISGSTTLGCFFETHKLITKYILNRNDYETFSDFLIQKKKNTQAQIRGLEDLVVDGMEERFINEFYSPSDEIKIKLPTPVSVSDAFTCPICYNEDCHMLLTCKHCNTKICYECCVRQAKTTCKCPMCNKSEEFEEPIDKKD